MKKTVLCLVMLVFTLLTVSMFYPLVAGNGGACSIDAPYGATIEDGNIDGIIGTDWDDAGSWSTTSLGLTHQVRAKHDSTYLYILLVVDDATDDAFDVGNPTGPHDWLGIEFDLNNDTVMHGTVADPDDWGLVNYEVLGGEDWWSTGMCFGPPPCTKRGADTSSGGANNVIAGRSADGIQTFWEIKKELDSGDTAGSDIAMDPTQTGAYGKDRVNIAFSYQDGATGMHASCSSFCLLVLGTPPQYTLTILSLPTGVTFTADGSPETAPWSDTYYVGETVNLLMPATHGAYVWSAWHDTEPNRDRAVTVNEDITLSGFYQSAVGGKATPIVIPTNPVLVHISWIVISTLLLLMAAAFVLLKHKARKH